MTSRFACSLILLIAYSSCCSLGEEVRHYLFCVVQNPIHPGKDPSGPDYAQDAGVDARELATELSHRERDGQPVTAVSLTRDIQSTNAAIERAGCSYIIHLERHIPTEDSSFPDGLGPANPMRDQEMIMYNLRSHDSRKKILSATVPPTTYRGRSERPTFVPYPLIADAVLKKVLMLNGPDQERR